MTLRTDLEGDLGNGPGFALRRSGQGRLAGFRCPASIRTYHGRCHCLGYYPLADSLFQTFNKSTPSE